MNEMFRAPHIPVALLAGAVLAVSACADDGDGEMSRAGSSQLAEPGQPVRSPSGQHTLEIVEGEYGAEEGGGSFWRVRIRDGSDEVVLDSDKRFSARFVTLALWGEREDRAWLYSSDVGTYYFEVDDLGSWSGHSYGPEGVSRNEPAVPPELVKRAPESFGPEGREKAARIVRERAQQQSQRVVCRRTPDGEQKCERGTGGSSKPVSPDDPRLNLPE